jgi:hypothetical protein
VSPTMANVVSQGETNSSGCHGTISATVKPRRSFYSYDWKNCRKGTAKQYENDKKAPKQMSKPTMFYNLHAPTSVTYLIRGIVQQH